RNARSEVALDPRPVSLTHRRVEQLPWIAEPEHRGDIGQVHAETALDRGVAHLDVEIAERDRVRRSRRGEGERQGGGDPAKQESGHRRARLAAPAALGKGDTLLLPRLADFGLAKHRCCAMIDSFNGVARLRPLPRERVRARPGPPKEQPPRNLSGEKDRVGERTLWKAGGGFAVPPKG